MKKIIIFVSFTLLLTSCWNKQQPLENLTGGEKNQKNEVHTGTSSPLDSQVLTDKTPPSGAKDTLTGSSNEGTGVVVNVAGKIEIIPSGKAPEDPVNDFGKPATERPQIDPLKLPPPNLTKKDTVVILKLGKNEFQTKKNKIVTLTNIQKGAKLGTKVHISGKVPSTWVFEGSFPVKVLDAYGGVMGEGVGKVDNFDEKKLKSSGNEYVEFNADFEILIPALTKKGFIQLSADNPSALLENDDSVSVGVIF